MVILNTSQNIGIFFFCFSAECFIARFNHIRKSLRLEQIQHTVKIYRFADMELILRLGHVIEQKFQNHGAAESPKELQGLYSNMTEQ